MRSMIQRLSEGKRDGTIGIGRDVERELREAVAAATEARPVYLVVKVTPGTPEKTESFRICGNIQAVAAWLERRKRDDFGLRARMIEFATDRNWARSQDAEEVGV